MYIGVKYILEWFNFVLNCAIVHIFRMVSIKLFEVHVTVKIFFKNEFRMI